MARSPRLVVFVLLVIASLGLGMTSLFWSLIKPSLCQLLATWPTLHFAALPWRVDAAFALTALALLGVLILDITFGLIAATAAGILVEDLKGPPNLKAS